VEVEHSSPGKPDIVVTDWEMPGESGLDLIHPIREALRLRAAAIAIVHDFVREKQRPSPAVVAS
jgi:CheY-like chemotaxis protein